MENNQGWPEFTLGIADTAKAIGKRLVGLCSYFPPTAPDYMSNHYQPKTGAAELLDQHLGQGVLPFEPTDGEAIPAPTFGWDSEGTYIERNGDTL